MRSLSWLSLRKGQLDVKKKGGPVRKLTPLFQFKLGISIRNIVSKRKNLKTRFRKLSSFSKNSADQKIILKISPTKSEDDAISDLATTG